MGLKCGLVGLPNSGKTMVFNAITGAGAEAASFPYSTLTPNVASVPVPDERLERIHAHVETDKVVAAELNVVDIAGLPKGASRGEGMGTKFLGALKECDALLHVVRCFPDPDAPNAPLDPPGDLEIVELELGLADLETVERNLERVTKKARTGDKEMLEQRELFQRAKDWLESEKQLRHMPQTPREKLLLAPLFLLTQKPVLYVANLPDAAFEGGQDGTQHDGYRAAAAFAESAGSECLAIAGRLEAELADLDEDERLMFMEELGIRERGLARLIRAAFHLLGLRTFFTAGEKEIKAWTFAKGSKAPQAAAVIHTDFEKKFIRAQIYSLEDLETHRKESEIKAHGKLRIEGKDYEMQDGDIVEFLIGK